MSNPQVAAEQLDLAIRSTIQVDADFEVIGIDALLQGVEPYVSINMTANEAFELADKLNNARGPRQEIPGQLRLF